MKKEIRDVKDGIVRITTVDERWYARPKFDAITKLPSGFEFVPSVTWIAEHYPKGIGFYKWLADKGWDESQALKEAAGDKGSKVHAAIVDLLDGLPVAMDAQYVNPSTGQPEFLTLDEYHAIMSFAAWEETEKPVTIGRELVIWNDQDGYAGTVDYLCTIAGELYVIDFKTSKAVWPGHRMQVSAYKHANPKWATAKLGILQLGYERNKMGYKFTEIEDVYPLFLATKQIWAAETAGQTPSQKDYPVVVQLTPRAATAPDSTTAQASGSTDTGATPTAGGLNGGTERVGEETKQDADSRRRGNSASRVPGVQGRR